jgi:hypothetical protein
VFHNYLDAGRLPWPGTALPDPVNRALSAWQQHKQTAFELALERVARQDRQLIPLPRLKPHKATKRGFHIPGEIDLIIIDVRRRGIWVVEAKDCQVSVDPDRLLHDVTDFHGIPDDVGHRHRGYARHPRTPLSANSSPRTQRSRARSLPWWPLQELMPVMAAGPWSRCSSRPRRYPRRSSPSRESRSPASPACATS